MRYLITGGSGFIGRALCASLADETQHISVLTRDVDKARRVLPERVQLITSLEAAGDVDAVVNLAGEGLADRRWTPVRKQVLRESRIGTTRALFEWMQHQSHRPRMLVSGSAIGWYGPRGDEPVDESAGPGSDFGAQLCLDWEAQAMRAESLGVRVCRIRTGVVLDRDGGALQKMLLPFRLGLGGPIGDGQQWMSWITRSDLVTLIRWLIDNGQASGAYNATAPQPATNAEFAATLAHTLHRPAILRTPAFALKLLLGEMADLLLSGQRVQPERAPAAGFGFRYERLADALADILK